jgi:predicted ester cyclase
MKLALVPSLVMAAVLAAGSMMTSCSKSSTMGKDTTMAATGSAGSADAQLQSNIDVTHEFVEKVLNNGDMKFAEDHTDANFVEHNPAPGQPQGLEGFKKWLTEWRAAFPDGKITIDDIIAQGDKVVIRNTFTGTHKGPFMGMQPTNKSVKVEGIDIVRIVNGKQTDHWGQFDVMGMMTQLGMMPEGKMGDAKMDSQMNSDTAAKMK